MSEISFRIGVECAMAVIAGAIVQKLAASAAAAAQAGLFHRTKLVGGVANAAFVTEELTAAEVAFCNAVGKVTAAVVVAGTRAGIAGVGEAIGSETLGQYVGDIPRLRGVVLEFLGVRDLNKATQILHFVAERAKDLDEAIDKSKAGEAPANRAVKIAGSIWIPDC